ncbi:MAG: hypothetical protein U0166_20490 [Acidobacteriota bacterium]
MGSTIATLLVLEGAMRLLPAPLEVNNPYLYTVFAGRLDPKFPSYREVYPLRFDARGYYAITEGAIDFHFDQLGGRWIEPAIRDLDAHTTIALGDSFTLGAGLRYEDTYIYRTERLLDGHPRFVNLARPGADATTCLEVYRDHAGAIAHEHVLYGLNLNDLIRFVTSSIATSSPAPSVWGDLAARSRLAGFVFARAARARDRARKIRELASPAMLRTLYFQRNLAAVRALDDESRRHGACLVVAILPILVDVKRETFAPTYAAIKDQVEACGIRVVELTRAVPALPDPDLWIMPFDQHPNEVAHAGFARALASQWSRELPDR